VSPPAKATRQPEHSLTIEQLAQHSGLSVRNIRSHQARGLLPPPEVRRRIGYYGAEHVERLRVIGDLQGEGLNLKAVKQLLDDTQGTVERLLDLKRSIAAPVALEESEVLTEDELLERLGPDTADRAKLLEKLSKLGFVAPIGAAHYEVSSPSLLAVLNEAVERGITAAHVADLVDSLHDHAQSISRRLTRSFVGDVWKPFVDDDAPDERWPEVAESIERLRPLGAQALSAVFMQTMSREVDAVLREQTRRLSQRKR
jgi:DNA-binding transcriptional MerR regulator